MFRIHKLFGEQAPLKELETIFEQVAAGQLSPTEAAERSRSLSAQTPIPSWLPRLLRFIGAAFAVMGLGMGCYSLAFARGTREVSGTVTNFNGGRPIVEFEVQGRRYSFQSSVSSSPPAYLPGDRVNVIYHPHDPASAQINSFRDRWLFPLAFTAGGAGAIAWSFLLPRAMRYFTAEN